MATEDIQKHFIFFFLSYSVFLYPQYPGKKAEAVKLPDDGQYEVFGQVEGQLRAQLKKLIMQGLYISLP